MVMLSPIEVEDGSIQRAMLEMARAHCKTCSFRTKWMSLGEAMVALAEHATSTHDGTEAVAVEVANDADTGAKRVRRSV